MIPPVESVCADRLANYLVDLSLNPDRLDSFRQNPERALTESPLSSGEKELLRSRDHARILGALGVKANEAAHAAIVVIVVVNLSCTGDDY